MTTSTILHDEECPTFDDAFTAVTEAVAQFRALDIIPWAATKLFQTKDEAIGASPWIPWQLANLIQLAVQFGGDEVAYRTGQLAPWRGEQDLHYLIDLVAQLESARHVAEITGPASVRGGTRRFMTGMAHHQFRWQRGLSRASLGRCWRLFCAARWPRSYDFNERCRQVVGLEPSDFLFLSFLLYCYTTTKDEAVVNPKNWTSRYPAMDQSVVDSYLRAVGLRFRDIRGVLTNRPAKNPYFWVLDESPLIRYPLLQRGSRFFAYGPQMVELAFEYGLYDRLQEADGSTFADAFGSVFEAEIQAVFSDAQIDFRGEGELKKQYEGKVVDCLVESKHRAVLIEAKATEATRHVRTNPSPKVLQSAFKSTLTKAASQMANVASQMSDRGIRPRSNVYGIAVSYKPLYVHQGQTAWDLITNADGPERGRFDGRNFLSMSVDEFDNLVWLCRGSNEKFVETVASMCARNAEPSKEVLSCQMHMRQLLGDSDSAWPDRLRLGFEAFAEALNGRMGKQVG